MSKDLTLSSAVAPDTTPVWSVPDDRVLLKRSGNHFFAVSLDDADVLSVFHINQGAGHSFDLRRAVDVMECSRWLKELAQPVVISAGAGTANVIARMNVLMGETLSDDLVVWEPQVMDILSVVPWFLPQTLGGSLPVDAVSALELLNCEDVETASELQVAQLFHALLDQRARWVQLPW
jgi:hypothetical protein